MAEPAAASIIAMTCSISSITRVPTLSILSLKRVGRDVGGVDLLEIGVGQRAVLRQRLVDGLIERRVVAGRVGVPDLVIARRCRLAQRLDLAERDLGERHRAFVLSGGLRHLLVPVPRRADGARRSHGQIIAAAKEIRRERYSRRGKRPVKYQPKMRVLGLAAHRAEQKRRQMARRAVIGRLARRGRRRLAVPGLVDPGDRGGLALLAPRRLRLACMRSGDGRS